MSVTELKKTPKELWHIQNSNAVRWYIMLLPVGHKGKATGLIEEQSRRIRNGEPSFDFFAPQLVESHFVDGELVVTEKPLLFNYIFVHASEKEIYKMKAGGLAKYNFLPRCHGDAGEYFPFLTDAMMKTFRWVAGAYGNSVPCVVPEPQTLVQGDKVRVTRGPLKGVVATVVSTKGKDRKNLIVNVENWLWVPLVTVKQGEYELVSLTNEEDVQSEHCNNDAILRRLHELMGKHFSHERLSEKDLETISNIQGHCSSLAVGTDIMRCKLFAIQLQVAILLNNTAERTRLVAESAAFYPLVKAEYAKALMAAILYLATDNNRYYTDVHATIEQWQQESAPKKSKQTLTQWVSDFDVWLGH